MRYFLHYPCYVSSTETPRLTRILGPEKNRVKRNRTVGGLWDYTMQRHRKIAPERGIALGNYSRDANFLVPKPKPRWSKIHAR